jgi:AraC family transcriptional regulator
VIDDNRLEYEKRVNRVVDYVREHLADDLSLAALARVAAFSPFHFHRVFRAITGETLFAFIQRQRIEKAAGTLLLRPEESVLAVALDHGFASAATFARAFRGHFGMSATRWRAGGAARWRARHDAGRKPGKQHRKRRKARRRRGADTDRVRRPEGTMPIGFRDLPTFHVAYLRYVGPYGPHGIPALWRRLHAWMKPRGFDTPSRITLGIAYDDPTITAPEQCSYDACVVVPTDFAGDRWVNAADVPGGRYAVAGFVGTADGIGAAWDRVFAAWLPGSGYAPDDRPCYELYRGDPMVGTGGRRFRCELCLPVRPL